MKPLLGRFSGFVLEDFLEIRLYESKLYELKLYEMQLYESKLYEMLLSQKQRVRSKFLTKKANLFSYGFLFIVAKR